MRSRGRAWVLFGRQAAACVAAAILFGVAALGSERPATLNPPRKHVASQRRANAKLSLDARQRFAEAEKLLGQGMLENALAAVQQGLKLAPRSIEGYNLLGIIYVQQKNYPQARAAFERALKLDPNSTKTHNNLGKSYTSESRLALAEQEFRNTLRIDPRNRDANYNLGLVLLSKGDAKQAITCLSRVNPPDPAVRLSLAQAYFGAGQAAKGLEVSRSLSSQRKEDVRVHFSLGVMLAAMKQYEEAVHEFELADALAPRTFEILFNLGQAYLRASEPEKGEAVLLRALSLEPDSAQTLFVMGRLYMDQRKFVQALEMGVKARKLAPQNTDVIFLLARISMGQAYFEDAIQLLEEGIKNAPNRPDLHAALGESLFTAGKVDKAIEEFQTLIGLDPSAGAYNFMGLCYRHLGRYDEAKKYFEEGLKLDPRNAACLYNLGYIENKQGNHEAAEKFLARALQSKPDYDDAMFELASLKMAEKKFEEALPLLRRCAEISPRPGAVYYKLATAERALHLSEAAERDLKIFQTLSKEPAPGPYPFQRVMENFDQRSQLTSRERARLDLDQLLRMASRNPGHPSTLYLLAETYLKLAARDEAKKWISELDKVSKGDFRTAMGVGVLLARYRLYPEAIDHFQMAVAADPSSDDAKYNLANAYFRIHDYPRALEILQQASPRAQQDDATLALLGDIYAHLGRTDEAVKIFQDAIRKNPENERYYLLQALAYLRAGNARAAGETLQQGLNRIPNSGQLCWGMGILSALEGKSGLAEEFLRKSVDLMPEWQGGYSALGVYYYEMRQVTKAREIVDLYAKLFPNSGLNIAHLQQALAAAQDVPSPENRSLSPEAQRQLLQLALALADQTP